MKETISRKDPGRFYGKKGKKRLSIPILNMETEILPTTTIIIEQDEEEKSEEKFEIINLCNVRMSKRHTVANSRVKNIIKPKCHIESKISQEENLMLTYDTIKNFNSNLLGATMKIEDDMRRQEENLESRIREKYNHKKVNNYI